MSVSLPREFILIYLMCWKTKIANFPVQMRIWVWIPEAQSRGWHFFGNPAGCGGGGWGCIANKVWHCFPCKTPRKRWHLTCFEIKNLADLRSLPFPLSLCLPCIYFLCRIADSVLGNFWSCSVDPGHLFFSLFFATTVILATAYIYLKFCPLLLPPPLCRFSFPRHRAPPFLLSLVPDTVKDHWVSSRCTFPTTHRYFNLDSIEKGWPAHIKNWR